MDKITHKVRCEQWTKIIKECLASGMNKPPGAENMVFLTSHSSIGNVGYVKKHIFLQ